MPVSAQAHTAVFLREGGCLDLRPIFSGVCMDVEAELVELGGEDEHVLLRMICPPNIFPP